MCVCVCVCVCEGRAFEVFDELVADAADLLEPLEFGCALCAERRERYVEEEHTIRETAAG